MMNAKLLVTAIAAAFFSVSAYAHDCSGGMGGGMDATGNQCNDANVLGIDESGKVPIADLIAPKAAEPATIISASSYAPTGHKVKSKKSMQHSSLGTKSN